MFLEYESPETRTYRVKQPSMKMISGCTNFSCKSQEIVPLYLKTINFWENKQNFFSLLCK